MQHVVMVAMAHVDSNGRFATHTQGFAKTAGVREDLDEALASPGFFKFGPKFRSK